MLIWIFTYDFYRVTSKRLATTATTTGGIQALRKTDQAPDTMSESYHEIFDTLMPPETAKARLLAESSETETDDVVEALSSCHLDKPSSPTTR